VSKAPRPFNLVAELTYRCPLRCPYCSNPVDWRAHRDALTAEAWGHIFRQAAELGVVHVGLTGGEPSVRRDLPEIVAAATKAELYTHLVTAGTPIDARGLDSLVERGLRSVQLSVQDANASASDRIAGTECFDVKLDFARAVRERGLPLILNVVLHRENLDRVDAMIELARDLDAERLELANAQYHGVARPNRAGLMPRREQLRAAADAVRAARSTAKRPEIVFVLPDYFSGRPKPCMGGWGRGTIVVAPTGTVQPCHEAGRLPGFEFWNAGERALADCWRDAPGMRAFRGEEWMPEPCRSCDERGRDFGGCRCQAFFLTGDASRTDPACELAPDHDLIAKARDQPGVDWFYRGDAALSDS
jgi:pyrroloquinoline quinone biosynthesis protein E